MEIKKPLKVLVTTNKPFICEEGNQHFAAFGELMYIHSDFTRIGNLSIRSSSVESLLYVDRCVYGNINVLIEGTIIESTIYITAPVH